MKNLIVSIISLSLILMLAVGGFIFVFWRFGIFKKTPTLSEEVLKIKEQTEFVQNYSFQEANNYLPKLSQEKIEIPPIATQELGRVNLFQIEAVTPAKKIK